MMKKKKNIFITILLCVATLFVNAQNWLLTGNSGTNTTSNFIGTKDAQSLVFKTSNVERIRIANNGFVGIGTTTPKALLNLPSKGSVTLSATDNFLLGSVTSNNLAFDYNKIQARNNGAANTLQLNPSGGAVALGNLSGTTSPGLYVAQGGAVAVGGQYIQPTYALTVNQGFTNNGVYLYKSAGSSEGYLLYGSNYASRGVGMFIENLASDNQGYAIAGRTYGTGDAIVGINANGVASSASIRGYNYGSGSGVYGTSIDGVGLYADGDNNYGIYARTTNATYAGYFNRSIFVNGSVFTSSDEKLKQNVQDFTSAIDIINQLHPKKYDFRQDGSYKLMRLPQGTHYGLIAQDVEKVLPNLVKNTKFETSLETPTKPNTEGKNDLQQNTKPETIDFKAVNYTELIPIIIKGMQEMQATISSQQRKIEELENRNASSNSGMLSSTSSSQATGNPKATGAYLKQNAPNPFNQNTVIDYYVPQNAGKAFINITDMNGRLIKTFAASSNGNGQLMIERGQFASGTYQYSLFINEKLVDSKRMAVVK